MIIGIDGNEANINQRVGSNVYAYELIKAIEQLDQQNNLQIYLRGPALSGLPPIREKFSYRVLPPKYLWTQWRLPLDLYFHQPHPNVFFTPGHYAPRFSPVPRVVSILDLSFLKHPNSFKPSVLRQLRNWTSYSTKKASHILAISNSTKRDIIEAYGINPEKITVTYPGINQRYQEEISNKQIEQTKQKYKINGKYIFTLGTKQPKKNLPHLLEAFSLVTKSLSNSVTLVIAGKTWHQFQQPPATSHKPQANVVELDYVPYEDLPALYKGAEAFVMPSLHEGFGIPAAEAMAIGTPVVVSNTTSLPEVVGDAGILVDPASTEDITQGIKSALDLSDQNKVQLIQLGKKQSQQFTWENCAKKTLEVLYEAAI